MTLFLLQIVDANHPNQPVIRTKGGSPFELDLIQRCTEAIVAKGVGFWKTEAQVKVAIAAGITETINSLKPKSTDLSNIA